MKSLTFAVDDSEIAIDGVPHTILGAVSFESPRKVATRLHALRMRFGLEEIKWNDSNSKLNREEREALSEEMLNVLLGATGLITIVEGKDRQAAAEDLAIQLADYLKEQDIQTLLVKFDQGIIKTRSAFDRSLQEINRSELSRMTYQIVDSKADSLIQCADLFTGFHLLLIAFALGRQDKWVPIAIEGYEDHLCELSLHVFMPLRHTLWGEIPEPKHVVWAQNYPFKHAKGRGFRIRSSVSPDILEPICNQVSVAYLGCMSG